MTGEEIAWKLNIGWKHDNWKMIIANIIHSELTHIAKSAQVNINGIVISIALFLPHFRSQKILLVCRWANYNRMWEESRSRELQDHYLYH